MEHELLTEERLRAALGLRPFRFYERVGSTNDLARIWASQGAPQGGVVVAEEQTAGRGRFTRAWLAPAGTALLMSTILRPRIAPERFLRLTMLGAVAVLDTLTNLAGLDSQKLGLKWPNDVLFDGRKVAGILTEGIWDGDRLEAVVLGIGLNVRVSFAGTELATTAISLETVTNYPINRAALLADILKHIDYWLIRLHEPALLNRWRASLTTLGRHVTVITYGSSGDGESQQEQRLSGVVEGVDDDGALVLRTSAGTIRRLLAGDVTLRADE